MVEDQGLNPVESIDLVEKYFRINLNGYILLKKTSYTGYWWVEYSNGLGIRICFEGDIGGHFFVNIFIDESEYSLWQFDRSVNNRTKSTNENILYQLEVVKIFLLESPI